MAKTSPFTSKSLCIVFAYAPAGLGHLRVTNSLRHGLPEEADPILLPESNESISWIHRLTSNNPLGKRLMEWAQYGRAEELVTKLFRRMLRKDSKDIEEKLFQILKQRIELPDTLLVVATHFGIAHQVAVIKERLAKRAGVKVILVMQVTDDSPQKIWYVPNSDLITVPSEVTKKTLVEYGKQTHMAKSHFVVMPYPISPHMAEELLPAARKHREAQLNPKDDAMIHVSVPVSGAAVGTTFSSILMKELHKLSKRFFFHIAAKRTLYTQMFIQSESKRSYASVYSSHSDRQIVELYEQAYAESVMSLEVTKPSEQAFKALMTPKSIGGVILLFTEPVGRQEYDNLAFLKRHNLIPSDAEHALLYEWAGKQWKVTGNDEKRILASTEHWRGLILPKEPKIAARFIYWCHQEGLFSKMLESESCSRGDILCREEVASDGVKKFWEEVEKLL